jgi:hypothetical protein
VSAFELRASRCEGRCAAAPARWASVSRVSAGRHADAAQRRAASIQDSLQAAEMVLSASDVAAIEATF